MAGRARRAGDRQCVDPKPVDLRQPRRPRLWRGTVSRRLRRAGCQRHRDAQHPWAEQCPSGADHDIDPRQRGWADWFRANDGTDYFDLDQAYPISTNGLLFDVGTTTAQMGPLSPVRHLVGRDGYAAAFTGNVGGAEYYNLQGSAMASGSSSSPQGQAQRSRCKHRPRGELRHRAGCRGRTGWL